MNKFMQTAIEEAKKGLEEGGIPIGSVLVYNGEIIGRGHNRRVQKGSAILHEKCAKHGNHRLPYNTTVSRPTGFSSLGQDYLGACRWMGNWGAQTYGTDGLERVP